MGCLNMAHRGAAATESQGLGGVSPRPSPGWSFQKLVRQNVNDGWPKMGENAVLIDNERG